MHPVNILRIFAFSLVLGHSNSNNTLLIFNSFGVFLGHPVERLHFPRDQLNKSHGGAMLVFQTKVSN